MPFPYRLTASICHFAAPRLNPFQVRAVLGPELAPLFCMVYGIDDEGGVPYTQG